MLRTAGQIREGWGTDMRKLTIESHDIECRALFRVTALDALAAEWEPELPFLVPAHQLSDLEKIRSLRQAGLHNLTAWVTPELMGTVGDIPLVVADQTAFEREDVVAITPLTRAAHVLHRRDDLHHSLFVTNRCNSYCLMCSQPPTSHDDSWLVDEAMQLATLIKTSPVTLGISGGEPLLIGPRLRCLIDTFTERHPKTTLEILTNGRLLSDTRLSRTLLHSLSAKVRWLVPLYGHADFLHDYVVQSPGAFEQTLDGLLTLQAHGQPIQLRIVLVEPVLKELVGLCEFIGRNLPFVQEVALMGCEPIGFALANRDQCQVDLRDWHSQLVAGTAALQRTRLQFVLMNTPLCALPTTLWPYAHRSISDWKQTYAAECEKCAVKTPCSGLFTWYERGWKPTAITPV